MTVSQLEEAYSCLKDMTEKVEECRTLMDSITEASVSANGEIGKAVEDVRNPMRQAMDREIEEAFSPLPAPDREVYLDTDKLGGSLKDIETNGQELEDAIHAVVDMAKSLEKGEDYGQQEL